MMFESERKRLLDEAYTWLKTPHHHQGRVKGAFDSDNPGGVDCIMLFSECFHRAGFIESLPYIEYAHDGHLHRGEEILLEWLSKYAHRISRSQTLPADLVVYKFGRRYSHGGIIIEPGWPRIIHAVLGRCVEYGNGDTFSSGGHHPADRQFWRYDGWRE